MGLSITLGVLFIIPILIPGKAAELPTGTVFDAYVDRSWTVDVGSAVAARKIDLSHIGSEISVELLYDKLAEQETPEYFEFEIVVPEGADRRFVIDRVNDAPITPLTLMETSESTEDDEVRVSARIKIKTLLKQFVKGINSIEVANTAGDQRAATKIIVDIEI